MTNIPAPVIWFGITAFIAIAFGLAIGHINAIGFDAYIVEQMKMHDCDRKEAHAKAIFSFWFNWVVVIISGCLATAFLAQSILTMFKF